MSRVKRNPIPKDARAARNLRNRLNRLMRGMRPYDTRSPIKVEFQEGITDGFCISNLSTKDQEKIASGIRHWDFSRGGFVWRANLCSYLITPVSSPLRVHPVVLVAGLTIAACPLNACLGTRDPRTRKHVEFLADAVRRKEAMAA